MRNFMILFLASVFLALLLQGIGMPIPYLLAPLLLTVFCNVKGYKFKWQIKWRNLALIPIGYGLGRQIEWATCQKIFNELCGIGASTFFLTTISVIMAVIISRKTKIAIESSLIGNMPGGLTQMLLLSEELSGVDANVVTIMQTVRLVSTIVVIPFIVLNSLSSTHDFHSLIKDNVSNFLSLPDAVFMIATVLVGVFLARLIKIPTPYMLGALLITAVLNIVWQPVPEIDRKILKVAQIFVGIQMGQAVELPKIKELRQHLPIIISSSVVVIIASFGLGYLLRFYYGYDLATAFLATAPGGITEMSITGLNIGADVSIILAYQLFRLIFMSALMPVLLKGYFNYRHTTA